MKTSTNFFPHPSWSNISGSGAPPASCHRTSGQPAVDVPSRLTRRGEEGMEGGKKQILPPQNSLHQEDNALARRMQARQWLSGWPPATFIKVQLDL